MRKKIFKIFIAEFVCPSCDSTYASSYVAANRFTDFVSASFLTANNEEEQQEKRRQ